MCWPKKTHQTRGLPQKSRSLSSSPTYHTPTRHPMLSHYILRRGVYIRYRELGWKRLGIEVPYTFDVSVQVFETVPRCSWAVRDEPIEVWLGIRKQHWMAGRGRGRGTNETANSKRISHETIGYVVGREKKISLFFPLAPPAPTHCSINMCCFYP